MAVAEAVPHVVRRLARRRRAERVRKLALELDAWKTAGCSALAYTPTGTADSSCWGSGQAASTAACRRQAPQKCVQQLGPVMAARRPCSLPSSSRSTYMPQMHNPILTHCNEKISRQQDTVVCVTTLCRQHAARTELEAIRLATRFGQGRRGYQGRAPAGTQCGWRGAARLCGRPPRRRHWAHEGPSRTTGARFGGGSGARTWTQHNCTLA